MARFTDNNSNPTPDHLVACMQLGLAAGEPWQADELAAALEYELSAPLAADMVSTMAPNQPEPGSAPPGGCSSLRELFAHDRPSLDLLRLAKDFAKANSQRREGSVPPDVALVLYYASIAAGMVHSRVRLTQLDDTELASGLDWALNLAWLDPFTRELLAAARDHTRPARPGG